jgi:hypothetical protein
MRSGYIYHFLCDDIHPRKIFVDISGQNGLLYPVEAKFVGFPELLEQKVGVIEQPAGGGNQGYDLGRRVFKLRTDITEMPVKDLIDAFEIFIMFLQFDHLVLPGKLFHIDFTFLQAEGLCGAPAFHDQTLDFIPVFQSQYI